MKKIAIVLIIIILVVVVWFAIQTKPDALVPVANVTEVNSATSSADPKVSEVTTNNIVSNKEVDNASVKIAFKGFGPGKVHSGSFSKIDSKLSFSGNDLKGEVTVDMNSLTTDTEAVTKHLKTDAFFDVAKYPTATFKLTPSKDGKISGVMTIHGVSKNVSFDAIIEQTYPERYVAKFNIDMKEFGIDQKFANEVVEVTVTVLVK